MTIKTTPKASAKPKLASVQGTAKAVYEKGTSALDEMKSFAKGNVDAVMESGKILGTGLKHMGMGYVAGSRGTVAVMNNDMKELAAAMKSPVDLFKLQSKIIGRNFGAMVDFQSKNAEAMMKLAKDSAAPLSKRVSAAVEKVRKVA